MPAFFTNKLATLESVEVFSDPAMIETLEFRPVLCQCTFFHRSGQLLLFLKIVIYGKHPGGQVTLSVENIKEIE